MSEPSYDYNVFESMKRLACRCASKGGTLARILDEKENMALCFPSVSIQPLDKFCEYQGERCGAGPGKGYFECRYSKDSPKRHEDSEAH